MMAKVDVLQQGQVHGCQDTSILLVSDRPALYGGHLNPQALPLSYE